MVSNLKIYMIMNIGGKWLKTITGFTFAVILFGKNLWIFGVGWCRTDIKDDLKVALCYGKEVEDFEKENLPSNTQVIEIINATNLVIRGKRPFANFSHTLLRLKIVNLNEYTFKRSQFFSPSEVFSSLFVIEYLEFSSSALEDIDQFELPPSLKVYVVANNRYTRLSVKGCPKLEELNANDNTYMGFMPELDDPPPPLHTLRLKNNYLNGFTIKDLAPLCNLKTLELQFPSESFYNAPEGSCSCRLLKKWIEFVEIPGLENLECRDNGSECSDRVWKKALDLHKNCPPPARKFVHTFGKWLLWFLSFVVALFFVLAVGYFVYNYFHNNDTLGDFQSNETIDEEEGEEANIE